MAPARENLTAIFAKQPVPGQVKTRLAPALDPDECAGLALAMLRDLAARLLAARPSAQRPSAPLMGAGAADTNGAGFRGAPETTIGAPIDTCIGVAYAPATAGAWFRRALPELDAHWPQRGDGLARRLAAFFAERFAKRPAATVVVVGSDAPLLPVEQVGRAHAALTQETADVVLTPDGGGGYCLVGLSRPCPPLFTEVAMSTGDMLERTLAVAAREGLRVLMLEPSFDVDVPADLERLVRELAQRDPALPDHPRSTAAWLAARELTP